MPFCRNAEGGTWSAVLPLRKFYSAQMFLLLRMQLRSHVDAQPVKRFKLGKSCARYMRYKILNVATAREWDLTAQMVWWYCACAVAHLGGNIDDERKVGDLLRPKRTFHAKLTNKPFWRHSASNCEAKAASPANSTKNWPRPCRPCLTSTSSVRTRGSRNETTKITTSRFVVEWSSSSCVRHRERCSDEWRILFCHQQALRALKFPDLLCVRCYTCHLFQSWDVFWIRSKSWKNVVV